MKKICPGIIMIFLLGFCSCGKKTSLQEQYQADKGPSGQEMRRLAVRALRDAGQESRKPAVRLEQRLGPQDYLVSVLMDNGRWCRGRLFKDRARYRLTLDLSTVYQEQVEVRVKN